MARIKFLATWTPEFQDGIRRGLFAIQPDTFYNKMLDTMLKKLADWQEKKQLKLIDMNGSALPEEYLRKLVINIEINYQGRTLDQNALLWAIYQIFANEMNAGMSGALEQMVMPMELYEADLREFGEREQITTSRKNLNSIRSEYRIVEFVTWKECDYELNDFLKLLIADEEIITAQVIRGTSKLNTREMGQWIDRLFNRLAWQGIEVTTPGEIEGYWLEHKQYLNDKKIVLNDDRLMTQDEYKELNPCCEATGEFLGNGGGELAHIQGFGMGGDRSLEPAKNYASNWLHLKTEIHRGIWHGQGWKSFIKQFPHLRYKIELAMKKDYGEI